MVITMIKDLFVHTHTHYIVIDRANKHNENGFKHCAKTMIELL
jgi:hypothetical protein